jgi:hypothetical protein
MRMESLSRQRSASRLERVGIAAQFWRQRSPTYCFPMGLDVVEMVMAIEREYHIELADAELAKVSTIGELEALVAKSIGAAEPEARARLHERLLDIIVEETAVDREHLVHEARIYKDLGLG